MTDESVDQTNPQADEAEAKIAVLQAVVDRVTSWQDGAEPATVRQELDDALAESDVDLSDAERERVVQHIVDEPAHIDVRQLLG